MILLCFKGVLWCLVFGMVDRLADRLVDELANGLVNGLYMKSGVGCLGIDELDLCGY